MRSLLILVLGLVSGAGHPDLRDGPAGQDDARPGAARAGGDAGDLSRRRALESAPWRADRLGVEDRACAVPGEPGRRREVDRLSPLGGVHGLRVGARGGAVPAALHALDRRGADVCDGARVDRAVHLHRAHERALRRWHRRAGRADRTAAARSAARHSQSGDPHRLLSPARAARSAVARRLRIPGVLGGDRRAAGTRESRISAVQAFNLGGFR